MAVDAVGASGADGPDSQAERDARATEDVASSARWNDDGGHAPRPGKERSDPSSQSPDASSSSPVVDVSRDVDPEETP
jgi:hypothetical protein